jgi:hypothetical protein
MQRTDVYGTRTVTLVVAIATLTSNALSSALFSQLPDDPYHLASKFGWYLHLANVLSVFGFIGALRVWIFSFINRIQNPLFRHPLFNEVACAYFGTFSNTPCQ